MYKLFNVYNIEWDSSESEDDEWLFESEHPSSIDDYEVYIGYDAESSIRDQLISDYDAEPISFDFDEVDDEYDDDVDGNEDDDYERAKFCRGED